MSRLLNSILDLIYPPKCSFCRKIIDAELKGICQECAKKLPRLEGDCRKTPLEDGTHCFSALRYDGMVRDSFLRYKFYGAVSYADTYSGLLAESLKDIGTDFDLVTWVPLSRRRKRKRGYDQAELIAEGTSHLLGLDCKRILYKNKETKAQSLTRGGKERRNNVKGAWSICDNADVKDKRILVFDDIVTTGATLSECCAVLKRAGALSVTAATLAKAAE